MGLNREHERCTELKITCKVKSRHLYQTVWTNISLWVFCLLALELVGEQVLLYKY